jgi:hypothetical protein
MSWYRPVSTPEVPAEIRWMQTLPSSDRRYSRSGLVVEVALRPDMTVSLCIASGRVVADGVFEGGSVYWYSPRKCGARVTQTGLDMVSAAVACVVKASRYGIARSYTTDWFEAPRRAQALCA